MKLPASLLATMALASCGPMYDRRTTPQIEVIEIEEGAQEIEPTQIEPVEVQHFAQPPPSTPPAPQPVHVVDNCPGCGMG